MVKLIALLSLLLISSISHADDMQSISQRCAPEQKTEDGLKASDFSWGYTLPDSIGLAKKVYESKRLSRRAYYDTKTKSIRVASFDPQAKELTLPLSFINVVTSHIEKSLKQRYADSVFFPDMGHSHFLIPNTKWQKIYDKIPTAKYNELYQKMFLDPELKILYHTAEQIVLVGKDDKPFSEKSLFWRYLNRNVVGANNLTASLETLKNPESKTNTVSEVAGYFWWGSGFNISANKDGCFSYQASGQTYYYDISFNDLEGDSGSDQ